MTSRARSRRRRGPVCGGTHTFDPLRRAEEAGPLLAHRILGVERGARLRELRVLGADSAAT
jgi:hypothetical protein